MDWWRREREGGVVIVAVMRGRGGGGGGEEDYTVLFPIALNIMVVPAESCKVGVGFVSQRPYGISFPTSTSPHTFASKSNPNRSAQYLHSSI